MYNFETRKKDDSVFEHKLLIDGTVVDIIENYSDKIDINNYVAEVGVKLNPDILVNLDKDGIFKKYTDSSRVDGNYVCNITYTNNKKTLTTTIKSKKKIPDNIIINTCTEGYDDVLYVNHWTPSFIKSLSKGYIMKKDNDTKALVIEVPVEFVDTYFKNTKNLEKTISDFVKKLVCK
jgi:hypothetical protein